MRLLVCTAETCPTFRPDVRVLFGEVLPEHGIFSDVVAGRTPGAEQPRPWSGGEARLCEPGRIDALNRIRTFVHRVSHVLRADRRRYDGIQVRDMPVTAALALLAARAKSLKFFYWMSYPLPEGQTALARERGLSRGLARFLLPWLRGLVGHTVLYRFVLPRADHVFVQSDYMKQALAQRGIRASAMTVVPMGVALDAARRELAREPADASVPRACTLVYLGTLDRPRQIERLFDVLASVRRRVPDVRLRLVGDTHEPEHRRALQAQAAAAGVAGFVEWTGWLSTADAWQQVRGADVGLSLVPRGVLLDCGSPTKVPEYLALGVPVVGNDNPDQARVIRESGAGLVANDSDGAFADAVVTLLELDPQARDAMVERGREYVSRHRDYRVIGRALAAAYRTLLEPSRSAMLS